MPTPLTTQHITRCGVTLQATDDMQFGTQWGTVIALTPCCKAAATGTTAGIVCKGCHAPVSDLYAAPLNILDMERLAREAGCSCPQDCIENAQWVMWSDLDRYAGRQLAS